MLFDLDGTLYHQLPLRLAMACEMAIVCGATFAAGGWRIPRVLATFRRRREALREPGLRDLCRLQYSAPARDLRTSPEHVERVVVDWMYRRPLKWIHLCRRRGVIELLRDLENRGVRRGVLSDYPAQAKIEALGLAGRFDPVLCTADSEIDAFKPQAAGFIAAATYWGLPAHDVLYVGDRIEVDAAGAAAAGMRCAILTRQPGGGSMLAVRDFDELREALESLC